MLPGALEQRSERVRIYRHQATGTAPDIHDAYVYLRTAWASFEPAGGRETTVAGAAQQDSTAVFGFYDRVDVCEDDVLVLNGITFRVTGIPDPRTSVPNMLRPVNAIRADRAQFELVG